MTGEVEGILVRGKPDYVPSIKNNPLSCYKLNICDENGKSCSKRKSLNEIPNEQVTYISQILPYIKK